MKNNTANLIDEIFVEPEVKHGLNVFKSQEVKHRARFPSTKTVILKPDSNVDVSK